MIIFRLKMNRKNIQNNYNSKRIWKFKVTKNSKKNKLIKKNMINKFKVNFFLYFLIL